MLRLNSYPFSLGILMKTQHAMAQIYCQADRTLVTILWAMLAIAVALSGMHDTLGWALTIGLPAVGAATIAALSFSGTRLSRMIITCALMTMCALHIHQGNGRDELHFGLFVALAFLLCYRDWSVIVFAAALAAVHHLSFNYLQQLGYGVVCFTRPGLAIVFLHAGYVVAETLVLCHLALMLERDALQSAELRASVTALCPDGEVVDLTPLAPASTSSGKALQEALGLIRTSIARVQNTVETTKAAAAQIADGSTQLFARTQEQSIAIQVAVQAMSTLSTSIQSNAEHSQQADNLASAASSVAERGGQQVTNVVERMTAISKSSKKIAEIISVIDSIAFQTSILALNAAVEAARAGEQGRGFAVVASEVRNLAQRSSIAAREIASLIDESVAQVSAGGMLAHEAGQTMVEIVKSVKDVTGIIGEISKASSEQANRVSSVCEAIEDMEKSTQQNATMVKETSQASNSLREQAYCLTEVVNVFRLNAPTHESVENLRRLPA